MITDWIKMEKAPIQPNDDERLKALYDLQILDTPKKERFDLITRVSAKLFQVPFAAITFVDKDREWHKSTYGFEHQEGRRETSFSGVETEILPPNSASLRGTSNVL